MDYFFGTVNKSNDQSTNDQSTNDQSTNDQSTNDQSTNDQSTNALPIFGQTLDSYFGLAKIKKSQAVAAEKTTEAPVKSADEGTVESIDEENWVHFPERDSNKGYTFPQYLTEYQLASSLFGKGSKLLGKEMTGEMFNQMKGIVRCFKYINSAQRHHGYLYQKGLNEDSKKWRPEGSCKDGGLYFTFVPFLSNWEGYSQRREFIYPVEIPNGANIYIEPEGGKAKADKIIVGDAIRVDNLINFSSAQPFRYWEWSESIPEQLCGNERQWLLFCLKSIRSLDLQSTKGQEVFDKLKQRLMSHGDYELVKIGITIDQLSKKDNSEDLQHYLQSSDFETPPKLSASNHPLEGKRVLEILEIDRTYRKPGITDDLKTINQIDFKPDTDIDLYPIVKASQKPTLANKIQFIATLIERYPFIEHIEFSNLLLAGGAVSYFLKNASSQAGYGGPKDFDFFIYGLDKKQANEKVQSLVSQLVKYCKTTQSKQITGIIKSENLIQIIIFDRNKYEKIEIQVIFRLYSSISEILHGFDVGSSAVGYDGTDIYFTTLSEYAYSNWANIVDPSRRSTTYEKRLRKYYQQGFHLIFPELTPYYNYFTNIAMPYLPFFNRYKALSLDNGYGSYYRYDGTTDYGAHSNSSSLLIDILSNPFSKNKLFLLSKQEVRKKLKKYQAKLNSKQRDLSYLQLSKWVTLFGKETIIKYIQDGAKPDIKTIFKSLTDRVDSYFEFLQGNFFDIEWKTQDPGTQLTSSFNPIIEDPKDWYGKFHYTNF